MIHLQYTILAASGSIKINILLYLSPIESVLTPPGKLFSRSTGIENLEKHLLEKKIVNVLIPKIFFRLIIIYSHTKKKKKKERKSTFYFKALKTTKGWALFFFFSFFFYFKMGKEGRQTVTVFAELNHIGSSPLQNVQ